MAVMATETRTLFCIGLGYTARAFARSLKGWRIIGTTRDAARADAIAGAGDGIEPMVWNSGAVALPAGVDAILISTPPNEIGCPALAGFSESIAARGRELRWIGYLSSNGVYGDHGGKLADEEARLLTSTPRGKRRIRAEADWASFAVSYALPLVIFRLPGIYGPGRSAIDALRAGEAKRIVKKGQVFSRAHVDDIAAVLRASLENPAAADLFNVADDEPAPPQDVVAYAAELLGVRPPPEVAFEDAALSDMARSFYAENKRVSNARMKERLGVALRYPTYREGLKAILAAQA